MDSKAFYDSYVDRQLRVGVNARHEAILAFLLDWGLAPDHRVLEVGAGVGTLTGLLVGALPEGELVALDLSPKSIEAARERLGDRPGLRLLAADVMEVELEGVFDRIVLPDVIEHIPLELHDGLFRRLAQWLAPEGQLVLHYPAPLYLEWCREHRPELLQHIDQPIHADRLTADAYRHGLVLDYLETYAIWVEEGDYQVARLRRRREDPTFTPVEERPSFLDRVKGKIGRWLS